MATTLYHYPGCSTCRRARKWLDAHHIEVDLIDLVASPPSKTALRRMWKASGLPLKRLFNTAGRSYRDGGFKDRLPELSDDEALAALAADGKLIKRPLLSTGEHVLVGFREADYEALLA